ncbi:MAG: hypothetical protein D4R73_10665 [Deltaproteobacteria bacterium]|nr:MAG: hypothetical protein D4R73_10665 [Deltaproteobacteria bacterium]
MAIAIRGNSLLATPSAHLHTATGDGNYLLISFIWMVFSVKISKAQLGGNKSAVVGAAGGPIINAAVSHKLAVDVLTAAPH